MLRLWPGHLLHTRMLIMEKIRISLSPTQLSAICHTLSHLAYEAGPTRNEQAKRSIMDGVGKKLLKKQIDGPIKDFKIAFAYHELDVLENFLRDYADTEDHLFSRRMIYKVADDINQKLA